MKSISRAEAPKLFCNIKYTSAPFVVLGDISLEASFVLISVNSIFKLALSKSF